MRPRFLMTLCLGFSSFAGWSCSDDEERPRGYAIWAASPQSYDEILPFPNVPPPTPMAFSDQTLRQIMRVSAGGDEVSVSFSNRFGREPVTIDAATIAHSTGGASVDDASVAELRFDGRASVTIATGEEVWSDFAPLSVAPDSDLAISLYFARQTPVHTVHSLARQTAYVTSGNSVNAATLPETDTRPSYYWISGIVATATRPVEPPRVLVAFGDSITDGFNSTENAARRYPNFLSADLHANAAGPYSVVNAGISGNRVLHDIVGPSGQSRFGRDALGQRGITDVVILLGINDIGFSAFSPSEVVSAPDVIAGLGGFVADAKADDLGVYLATLLPFNGAGYYSEEGEAKRREVNDWIRANPDVDGVVDFDRLMEDPSNPGTMLPAYDSSDHLHPNDDGYEAMAAAVVPTVTESK